MDLEFLAETSRTLLGGLPLTLKLAASSVALGAVLAVLAAAMRLSGNRVLDLVARAYVFVFRGTPLLVQVFLVYYGLGQFRPTLQALGLWTFLREPFGCALLALTLNTGAYAAEILRGGVLAVPHGALEAGRACGMSRLTLLRRVIAPLALRQALPAYGNELILMVKATSLASIITLLEVTGLAQKIIAQTYRALEVFVCAGAIYLAVNILLSRAILLAEWWLSPHARPPRTLLLPDAPAPGEARA